MQKYGSLFFVILFLVLMFVTRMSETLNCEAKDTSSISCTRTQERIFYSSKKKNEITDLATIRLTNRAISSKHNITAMNAQGKKIVLLSVPEKATDYAQEIIQKLKNLPQSEEKTIEHTRNEMHSQLLLLSLASLVILVCLVLLLRKRNQPAKELY